jgi:hypothetical protein
MAARKDCQKGRSLDRPQPGRRGARGAEDGQKMIGPGGLLEGLVQVLRNLSGILVKHGVVLHDQEAVVVLLQDGHELEDCEGAAHIQLRDDAVQPAEDTGVVAADEEDLVALQFRVAALGFGQQLHRGDLDAEGLGEQGDGGEEFDFHDGEQVLRGYEGEAGGGAKVKGFKLQLDQAVCLSILADVDVIEYQLDDIHNKTRTDAK